MSMADLRYRVLLKVERDGGFHAYMPELPGVHSHGRSREEALKNVEDAAKLYLADLKAEGEEPPQPAEETRISLSA
jgi:predicted RNase H-like HicB family nuclease